MNVIVKARHMDATDAMKEYVETKAARLERYYDGIQTVETILDTEADHAVAEIVVTARRKHTFVATHKERDLYACVDQCIDKVAQQLRRHKDKVRDRQGPSLNEAAGG